MNASSDEENHLEFEIENILQSSNSSTRKDSSKNEQSGSRKIVCKHWLRSLCKKGEDCNFLHQYDEKKMPECYFFSHYGECSNADCIYRHVQQTQRKDCFWYQRGFCKDGPLCRNRHVKREACKDFMEGVCLKGWTCTEPHPTFELNEAQYNSKQFEEELQESKELLKWQHWAHSYVCWWIDRYGKSESDVQRREAAKAAVHASKASHKTLDQSDPIPKLQALDSAGQKKADVALGELLTWADLSPEQQESARGWWMWYYVTSAHFVEPRVDLTAGVLHSGAEQVSKESADLLDSKRSRNTHNENSQVKEKLKPAAKDYVRQYLASSSRSPQRSRPRKRRFKKRTGSSCSSTSDSTVNSHHSRRRARSRSRSQRSRHRMSHSCSTKGFRRLLGNHKERIRKKHCTKSARNASSSSRRKQRRSYSQDSQSSSSSSSSQQSSSPVFRKRRLPSKQKQACPANAEEACVYRYQSECSQEKEKDPRGNPCNTNDTSSSEISEIPSNEESSKEPDELEENKTERLYEKIHEALPEQTACKDTTLGRDSSSAASQANSPETNMEMPEKAENRLFIERTIPLATVQGASSFVRETNIKHSRWSSDSSSDEENTHSFQGSPVTNQAVTAVVPQVSAHNESPRAPECTPENPPDDLQRLQNAVSTGEQMKVQTEPFFVIPAIPQAIPQRLAQRQSTWNEAHPDEQNGEYLARQRKEPSKERQAERKKSKERYNDKQKRERKRSERYVYSSSEETSDSTSSTVSSRRKKRDKRNVHSNESKKKRFFRKENSPVSSRKRNEDSSKKRSEKHGRKYSEDYADLMSEKREDRSCLLKAKRKRELDKNFAHQISKRKWKRNQSSKSERSDCQEQSDSA